MTEMTKKRMPNKQNSQMTESLVDFTEDIMSKMIENSPKKDFQDRLYEEIDFWLGSVSFSSFVEEISKEVIGQENLTLLLGNVYNYLYNVSNELPINNNMILAAPSGSGKTETYRALRRYFKDYIPSLPVYVQDLSRVTATGYRGMEPSDLLMPFFYTRCQDAIGLVFLDEFDKKLIPSYNGNGQDTNREAQHCLLTLIEGSMVQGKNGSTIDTSKIMFIGLGSFDSCREQKQEKPNDIGFGTEFNDKFNFYTNITKEDIIETGGIYELIGRFPIIINYEELKEDSIRVIINKIVQEIEKTFNCTISLSKSMEEYLILQANGHFGCRLIDSIIRQRVLAEYTKSMLNPVLDKKLHISFKDKDHVSHKWNHLSEKELKEKALLDAFDNAVNIPTCLI